MTFTYDLTTDIGQVRLELGDDTQGQGVKPDGTNLTDEDIQVYLTREKSAMRAVAGICEMLETRFAALCDISVGPRRESFSQIRDGYRNRALQLRRQYGGSGAGGFSITPNRADGYSAAEGDDYAA